uniref:L-lactate dehydrogenase (cytochrome) n=1 Tax=Paramoeba aestuarina TaxID=180227 RepID=A0A7S4JIJ4_9EUKA
MEEVARHNNRNTCWMVLFGEVYDLTRFLSEHPGGAQILLKNSGKDGTAAFSQVHSKAILKELKPEEKIGEINPKEAGKGGEIDLVSEWKEKRKRLPHLGSLMNVFEFEFLAKGVLDETGWAYYSSGAVDEITLRENRDAYNRVILRPRVLVDVSKIDMTTRILGQPTSIPLYITAAALGKMAHPEGEVLLTKAAHNEKIIQMCATMASVSLDEMVEAAHPEQPLFFQLYVNKDRKIAEETIIRAEKLGVKALCITVDAPCLGRREKDMRHKAMYAPDLATQAGKKGAESGGTARFISQFIDPSLNWDDIKWIKSITNLPLVLKGVQVGEDALKAVEYGVKAIILSNHGGRQADCCRSGLEILPEVMAALRSINAQDKMEVWVDGGIRRGSDIFKALALGAKCVGIGRPSLFALGTYGQEGVERMIQMFKEELDMCMVSCFLHIKKIQFWGFVV